MLRMLASTHALASDGERVRDALMADPLHDADGDQAATIRNVF